MVEKNKEVQEDKLKIMVASTVYNFGDQIKQICATLKGYGYHVLNSHIKTVPTDPNLSNLNNCLAAVESCDLIFGIITPRYGAVVDDSNMSITHREMKTALALKKPHWFIAHRDISVARQLFKQYMYLADGKPNLDFVYKRTEIFDDIRLIDLYNETILNQVPPAERIGHWVEEYFELEDILTVLETQFRDVDRVRKIVEQMKQK